jgi:hypothetical protein
MAEGEANLYFCLSSKTAQKVFEKENWYVGNWISGTGLPQRYIESHKRLCGDWLALKEDLNNLPAIPKW